MLLLLWVGVDCMFHPSHFSGIDQPFVALPSVIMSAVPVKVPELSRPSWLEQRSIEMESSHLEIRPLIR